MNLNKKWELKKFSFFQLKNIIFKVIKEQLELIQPVKFNANLYIEYEADSIDILIIFLKLGTILQIKTVNDFEIQLVKDIFCIIYNILLENEKKELNK